MDPLALTDVERGAAEPRPLGPLLQGAALGVAGYGAVTHAGSGVIDGLWGGAVAAGCAGLAFALSWPALTVGGAVLGSRLRGREVTQAALVGLQFGGLALLASAPVVLLVDLTAAPHGFRLLTQAVVLAGVGMATTLAFSRAFSRLEGHAWRQPLMAVLIGALFVELSWIAGFFQLAAEVLDGHR